MRATVVRLLLAMAAVQAAAWAAPPLAVAQTQALALDVDLYRETVEPILLARRRGNARCVVCHSQGGGNAFLEPLPPGSAAYDEEQSARNFERIQRLVVPGAPTESILLMNPLTEAAGGTHWHAGGKHWTTQDAAEWRTLARWVEGATLGASQ